MEHFNVLIGKNQKPQHYQSSTGILEKKKPTEVLSFFWLKSIMVIG